MSQPPDQPFDDEESLLRALRAPGSAGELGEEEQYVAMFREARDPDAAAPVPIARRRRAVSRFGAGSAFVVALAVSGSAAAAYTNNLPEPIQRFAHDTLGPVAPPAPKEHHNRAKDHPIATATPSTTPTPTPTPTTDAHSLVDALAVAEPVVEADAQADPDTYADGHADTDADAHSHTGPYSDTDPHADSDSDARAAGDPGRGEHLRLHPQGRARPVGRLRRRGHF